MVDHLSNALSGPFRTTALQAALALYETTDPAERGLIESQAHTEVAPNA